MTILRSTACGLGIALMLGAMPVGAQDTGAEAAHAIAAPPAPVAPAPLELYGRLPAFSDPALSPDGTKLAHLVSTGASQALLVMDLSTLTVVGGLREIENKVRDIAWVGNDFILISTSTTATLPFALNKGEYTQGLIYSMADRSTQTVFARNNELARIMIGGAIIRNTPTGPAIFSQGFDARDGTTDLYRVDPATNRATRITGGQNVADYLLDSTGEPVARVSYFTDTGTWSVDAKRGGVWPRVWSTTALLDRPSLVGFGRSARSVIVQAKFEGEDELQYRELSLDTGEWLDLAFETQPDGLVYHPVTKLMIGTIKTSDEGSVYDITDPVAARSWRSVRAAFAGRHPSIRSWASDMRSLVVQTDGNGDAGTYNLVDLDRGVAEIVGQAYPGIAAEQVGQIKPVSYEAADGMTIPGYLTLPPGVTEPKGLPLVVLPHGGPAARDRFGFDWWAQALAAQGYVVLQPNFRGSDGLGEAHLTAGYGQWGRKMQTDLSDGVRWLASEGIIDPARVCIVGASYGGYAAMAGPTLDPGVYRCAVAVAGVSDLNTMIRWSAGGGGQRNGPAVRYWMRFMGSERYDDPALDALSPALIADRADAPMLLIHGRDDTIVPYDQSLRLYNALRRAGKPVELVPLDGEDHWLSGAATRQRMLDETVRFLRAHNPAG
jgi:dipeptidyl aminopeptidase/acylaminoacyl peptidase